MKDGVRQHGFSVAISVITGLLVAFVVYGVSWASDSFEESQERSDVRTFLDRMEKDIFDDASIIRGVEAATKAGVSPTPNLPSFRFEMFSSWLDSFSLFVSVNTVHLSPDERYDILQHISFTQRLVGNLYISTDRIPTDEGLYRKFFKDLRQKAEWLK